MFAILENRLLDLGMVITAGAVVVGAAWLAATALKFCKRKVFK